MKAIFLMLTLLVSNVHASAIPECEYTKLKGSALFGAFKMQLEFTKLTRSSSPRYYLSTITSTPGKDSRYDIYTTTNSDTSELTTLERVKSHEGTEIKRNDIKWNQQTNSFLLRKKNTSRNEPYYNAGEILKLGQTLDLSGLLFYLRSLNLEQLASSKKEFSLYLMGPKGSLDNQKRPRQYSRMSFAVTKKKQNFKIEAKLNPLPSDPTPENSDQYEYVHIFLKNDNIHKITKMALKAKGKPSLELKLKEYKIIQKCD